MDEHRVRRVSEAVKEELSEIIGFEMSDPRLTAVDVTEVHVSPDSRHALVKVEVSGDEQELAGPQRFIGVVDHRSHGDQARLGIDLRVDARDRALEVEVTLGQAEADRLSQQLGTLDQQHQGAQGAQRALEQQLRRDLAERDAALRTRDEERDAALQNRDAALRRR